jgi:hypothetical protein
MFFVGKSHAPARGGRRAHIPSRFPARRTTEKCRHPHQEDRPHRRCPVKNGARQPPHTRRRDPHRRCPPGNSPRQRGNNRRLPENCRCQPQNCRRQLGNNFRQSPHSRRQSPHSRRQSPHSRRPGRNNPRQPRHNSRPRQNSHRHPLFTLWPRRTTGCLEHFPKFCSRKNAQNTQKDGSGSVTRVIPTEAQRSGEPKVARQTFPLRIPCGQIPRVNQAPRANWRQDNPRDPSTPFHSAQDDARFSNRATTGR